MALVWAIQKDQIQYSEMKESADLTGTYVYVFLQYDFL